jgi:S-adenosylmethionine hydrolase
MVVVTLTTDFGTRDAFVGIMKGVVATRAPGAMIIDLTHEIPPQDVLAGALVLRHATPYFPDGTIPVAVVDPGVGGPRRPLCVQTRTAVLVGPDNGLLSLAAPEDEVRAIVHLTDERHFLRPLGATFHGRDVFAPVAAALATGTPPAALGVAVRSMHRLEMPPVTARPGGLRGQVIHVDRFGNLVTNVAPAALAGFPPAGVSITLQGMRVCGIAASYGSVGPGEPVVVVNSWGLLEVAVRDGSAHATLGAGVGAVVDIEAVRSDESPRR